MNLCAGYTEIYEDHLTEALYTCCREYNKFVHQRIDMVFFREAARHTARLSRVLVSVIINKMSEFEVNKYAEYKGEIVNRSSQF